MKKRIIITSALPYANGPIHIGHLVEYIQTDVYVRFLKLLSKNAVYCCADDTHGAPIEINASKLGIKPEEFIAKYYKEHISDFKRFLIEFDSYYSTNSKENKHFSDLVFTRLKEKDLIYTKEVEQTYCENCKRFLPDRYVEGKCPKCNAEAQYGDVCEKCNSTYSSVDLIEPKCTICGNEPVRKTSRHYFFRLSRMSDKLKDWLETNDHLQQEVVNSVMNWINEGLEDWCISRDGPYFGFKVKGEEDKYYYVWLDAPIGYISSFSKLAGSIDAGEKGWNESEIIHFIGKDIIYFHLLFWPAMLMGSGFKLPKDVVVHGFLTVNDEKMSKSRGTFLTAREFSEKADPEFLRYYYSANLTHKMSDLDLDFNDFKDKINNELVANIANFAYRVLSFTNKNLDSELKDIPSDDTEKNLSSEVMLRLDRIKNLYETYNFREAMKEIMHISSIGNKYFQDKAPWKLIKEDKEQTRAVITFCCNILKNIIITLKPIMPDATLRLEKQLNLKELKWDDTGFNLKDHKIGKAEILIEKIDDISFGKQAFSLLNIKVAEIKDVQDHPDAEKLYVLKIDLGDEQRQLVAGIKGHYEKDELIGKRIVVVTNLKYAKLRGVVSEGMLLAGENDGQVGLVLAEKSKPGDQVFIDGIAPEGDEISIDDFFKIKLTAEKGRILWESRVLRTEKQELTVEKITDGKIR